MVDHRTNNSPMSPQYASQIRNMMNVPGKPVPGAGKENFKSRHSGVVEAIF